MTQQPIVVAHFKERADAHKAVAALVEAGFARTSAQVMPEEGASTYTRSSTTTSYDHTRDEGGFWSSLGSLPLPDEDRYAYAEGMSRGGATVSLTVDDETQAAEATDILERYGAVDLDQMEESWRSEGWAGYTAGTTAGTTTTTTTSYFRRRRAGGGHGHREPRRRAGPRRRRRRARGGAARRRQASGRRRPRARAQLRRRDAVRGAGHAAATSACTSSAARSTARCSPATRCSRSG
jgi:hypothetical protein